MKPVHPLARAVIAAIGQAVLEPAVYRPVFRSATAPRAKGKKTSYSEQLRNRFMAKKGDDRG
jgi:hypothetical protein